jgi:hypothetical protein
MNRIPITQTPGQATAIAVTMDQPQPVIGPAPHNLSYILNSMAHRLRNALVNALVVAGWIMGLVAILALASPTFEGWAEDVFGRVLYTLT